MTKEPSTLEEVIKDFAFRFQNSKRPTDLRDKTTLKLFVKGLTTEIRKYAVVTRRL